MSDPDATLRAEVERRMCAEAFDPALPYSELQIKRAVSVAVEMVKADRTRDYSEYEERIEDLERQVKDLERDQSRQARCLNSVSGALCDSGLPVPAEEGYGAAVRELVRQVKEAEGIAKGAEYSEGCMRADLEAAERALDEHKRKWRHVAECECHDKEQSNKCWSMDKSDGATQGKYTGLWLHRHPHRDPRCHPAPAESV